jgi:hypothetical protein
MGFYSDKKQPAPYARLLVGAYFALVMFLIFGGDNFFATTALVSAAPPDALRVYVLSYLAAAAGALLFLLIRSVARKK